MTLRVEGKIWTAIANFNDYKVDEVFSRDNRRETSCLLSGTSAAPSD